MCKESEQENEDGLPEEKHDLSVVLLVHVALRKEAKLQLEALAQIVADLRTRVELVLLEQSQEAPYREESAEGDSKGLQEETRHLNGIEHVEGPVLVANLFEIDVQARCALNGSAADRGRQVRDDGWVEQEPDDGNG